MKFTVTRPVEIDIKYIRLVVDVRYDYEDMPYDFPFRYNDVWDVTIDIDYGKIIDWPQGVSHDLHMKVCDQGSYWLLDENKKEIASIKGDYVPNGIIPGSYGDYIEMNIAEDGTITNWPKVKDVSEFFPE